jgi:hypothetical protein
MVPKFIAVVAFVVLAVFIVNTYISNDTDSMKSETRRIGQNMITNMKEIEK